MIHVVPVGDKVEHDASCKCCDAFLDPDGFWIHHAADKREQYERHGEEGGGWILKWEENGLLEDLEE